MLCLPHFSPTAWSSSAYEAFVTIWHLASNWPKTVLLISSPMDTLPRRRLGNLTDARLSLL
jgi:hypothetical protein